MRWQMGRRSENIEDRRGMSPGMGRGVRVGGAGGLGILAIALVAMFLGVDPSIILNSIPGDVGGSQSDVAPRSAPPPGDTGAEFVSAVLAQTEDTWTDIFAQAGQQYQDPQLVLFDGAVQSACGMAASATGPFYCPGDRKVYLDVSFFRELQERFGASGDFADAYVIAHEVGHHVQTLLGTSDQVTRARSQADQATANELSVRLELQADCYAGIWARHMQERQGVVEDGDIEEALGAASAVGDDRIQKATRGYVVPESFTHGTAQQRMRWFKQGLQTNDPNSCDTFSTDRL